MSKARGFISFFLLYNFSDPFIFYSLFFLFAVSACLLHI